MKRRRCSVLVPPRSGPVLSALVALVVASPEPAHAYVDFGLGSYAFQILIAWGLALAFALRAFWGRIILFIRRLLGR